MGVARDQPATSEQSISKRYRLDSIVPPSAPGINFALIKVIYWLSLHSGSAAFPPPERGEDVGWGGTGAAATLSTGAGPVMPGIAAVVGRVTGRDEKPGCHRSG